MYMEKNLYSMKGKVCLITGGSTGLGSYIAHGFLAAGASRVYITARSKDNLVKKKRIKCEICGQGYNKLEAHMNRCNKVCNNLQSAFIPLRAFWAFLGGI